MSKRYYQPVFDEEKWDKAGFYSFMVFRSKKLAMKVFPGLEIEEYNEGDIEDPVIVDETYKKILDRRQ